MTSLKIQTLVITTMLVGIAHAQSITKSDNEALAQLLTRMTILAEHDGELIVRVIREPGDGECDLQSDPITCPKDKVLIAVSNYGEAPIRRLYILDEGTDWQFVRWKYFAEDGWDERDFTKLELSKRVPLPRAAPDGSRFALERYEVRVNAWDASITIAKEAR